MYREVNDYKIYGSCVYIYRLVDVVCDSFIRCLRNKQLKQSIIAIDTGRSFIFSVASKPNGQCQVFDNNILSSECSNYWHSFWCDSELRVHASDESEFSSDIVEGPKLLRSPISQLEISLWKFSWFMYFWLAFCRVTPTNVP